MNQKQEKIIKIANEFAQNGAILPLKIAIEQLLLKALKRQKKGYEQRLKASRSLRLNQKKEIEKMIKEQQGKFRFSNLEIDRVSESYYTQALNNILKAIEDL